MIRIRELFAVDWREVWGKDAPTSGVGVMYTKPEVAAWMLDLCGYTEDSGPASLQLLDPGCGGGAFVLEAVRRLSASIQHTGCKWSAEHLSRAITAVEIDEVVLSRTRAKAVDILCSAGCPSPRATKLCEAWFLHVDFLLNDWTGRSFDIIIGNPPYVRLEDLPKPALAAYRDRFETANERADLYIPFFELGLDLLSDSGKLCYICANRFAKNKYGAALRGMISTRHHVAAYLNLEHATGLFEGKVAAYPAITILDNRRGEPTAVAELDAVEPATRNAVANALRTGVDSGPVRHFSDWHTDGSPWIHTRQEDADHHRNLEKLPLLEDSAPGTRIGIGVATGADAVFIRTGRPDGVEEVAILPLVEAPDIREGRLKNSDRWLLNPWREDGSLRDATDAPGLMRTLGEHETRLRSRHCAKKTPLRWHRTIDRIWPQWVKMPKLLLPDIQPGGIVAFDPGTRYPHHNVYWIVSEGWNLRVLQALMRSSAVTRQIRAHSVQMRGGALRYQTQTLRKIRIPQSSSLSPALVRRLASLAESGDQAAIDTAAEEAFMQATQYAELNR